jgi:hypothetical protein
MPSTALLTWQSDRAARIDRLEAAHTAVAGPGPGRRWLTDELNHSLVLRLAAEFQGYTRDLHDEISSAVVAALAPGKVQRQLALRIPYTTVRRLDRGNADPSGLSHDFGLFGMELWADLRRRYPTRGRQWQDKLRLLNEARNGVAHDDAQKISRVTAAGWPLTLKSVRRWRSALDGLAAGMDDVIGDHVQQLFGTTPW